MTYLRKIKGCKRNRLQDSNDAPADASRAVKQKLARRHQVATSHNVREESPGEFVCRDCDWRS